MKKNGVICAIDVNDFDQEVVDLAAAFAKQFDVVLDLLHVTLFPDPSKAAWPAGLGPSSQFIQDNRLLNAIETNVDGVSLSPHHLSGLPTEKILGFADRNQPRLLVMGTHGRRGLQRIFGSTASKVLRNANCPVMVLRQRMNSQDFADLQSN